MAAAALASSHAFAFEEDNLLPRPPEASFSPYLSSTHGGLSLRLSGEFTHNGVSMKKEKADADSELDVFSAEMYFSGSMNLVEQLVAKPENKPWKSSSPPKEAALPGRRTSSSGTLSASSETSGHSPGSLFQDAKMGYPETPHKPFPPAGKKKFLSIFRCPCVNNWSKETHGRKPMSWPEAGCNGETGTQKNDKPGSSFSPKMKCYSDIPPALNSVVAGNSTVGEEPFEEERKKGRRTPSVDVFRSPSSGTAISGLRRSLTMSTPFSSGAARDSDVCSESSSDLFELDHLATRTPPFGMGSSSASAMLSYEPSEASIEWTIVTASASNFSQVPDGERSLRGARKAKARQQQQRPGGLLMGCVGGKAVRISSNTCRFPENIEATNRRLRDRSMDAALPPLRYHVESPQLVDFDRRRSGHMSMARGVIPVHTTHRHSPH